METGSILLTDTLIKKEPFVALMSKYECALIAVETNYSRHPIRHLKTLGYENLYISKTMSTYNDVNEKHYGFVTTSVSRPIIIANLASVMRENLHFETDRQTLIEMTTFIKRDDGRSGACDGAHDDLVIASAIARYVSIDYDHNIIIIDTSEDFLEKNFSSLSPNNTFMEW